ncbi:Asp-tRNA(Asn)/Glu-tRNA(Gln) amidotransferase subunit GatA [Clostridium sp. LBM24168]
MEVTAIELKNLILNKKIKVEEVAKFYLDRIDKLDDKIGAYLYVAGDEAIKRAKELDAKLASNRDKERLGGLFGIPVAVKDNISVSRMQNTCASKMLEGYISPYDASVIERIKKEDGIILGKLNMDEFAMGSSTENSYFKITRNPWDFERVPGGSSGGSAASIASFENPLSLGTDTAGSVRQPSSFCGVVGLKPTYGRISRYGAVAFGSTLDQIGPMARTVEDCALLTQYIAGLDERDFTTADVDVPNYVDNLTDNIKGKRIGIPLEYFDHAIDDKVRKCLEEAIEIFIENGADVRCCSLPISRYSLAAYYVIGCAEASSNLARFDGIRYGHRSQRYKDSIDIYFKSRSEGLGEEVKKRIILGTYMLSKNYYDSYYKKALKIRNVIKKEFVDAMKEFDAIICPTCPTTAFKIGEKKEDSISMYMSDSYVVPANIAGIPSISIPCGMINGLPVGMQLMSGYFREDILFNLAYSFQQSTNYHKLRPKNSELKY